MTGSVKKLVVISLVLFAAAYGCGNPMDSVEESAGPAAIGIDKCYTCHEELGTSFDNTLVFTEWSQSNHGNTNNMPFAGYFGHLPPEDCSVCHDPNLDSQNLPVLAATGAPGGSTTLRPVVGCEACHGSGSGHFDYKAIAYPTPDYDRCGQCHNSSFDHNEEGDNLVEDYKSSPHIHSVNEHIFMGPGVVMASCSKCHTDEGGRLYAGISPDDIPFSGVSYTSPVQCRTCHSAHDLELLVPGNGSGSGEFNTCTNCHEAGPIFGLADAFHGESSDYSWSGFSVGVGEFDSSEIIYDTHFDDPSTADIEGFNLGPLSGGNTGTLSERVCRDCHNVHESDIEINDQWVLSGHAGKLGSIKASANASVAQSILDAGVSYGTGGAFRIIDMKASFMGACQRCHTSTGAMNYLDDPASPAANDFSYLASEQRELIYCWACHSDNSGGLREPGAIAAEYSYAPAYTFPDVSGSNVCVSCHSGRSSGLTVQNIPADFSSVELENSHYLAAGGILFNSSHLGYEYTGLDYSNIFYFEHDVIGVTETEGIGEEGPCVGCHMTAAEGHLFSPIEESTSVAGAVSDVTTDICGPCHDPHGGMPASRLTGEREGYEAALQALEAALYANSIFYASSHPYIFDTPTSSDPVIDWYRNGSTTEQDARNNMGAAFNLVLLHHEPGAYAHNSRYTKKLVFDSIDWLDDNNIDGTFDLTSIPGIADTQAVADFLHTDSSTSASASSLSRP